MSFKIVTLQSGLALWSVAGRFEPRLNLDSSQIVVIVGFGTWVPGLVEPAIGSHSSSAEVSNLKVKDPTAQREGINRLGCSHLPQTVFLSSPYAELVPNCSLHYKAVRTRAWKLLRHLAAVLELVRQQKDQRVCLRP